MAFDYSRLKDKIEEVFGTQDRFSTRTNMKQKALNDKLMNCTQFTQGEINRCCDVLSIDRQDIPTYFFTEESSETRTAASLTGLERG